MQIIDRVLNREEFTNCITNCSDGSEINNSLCGLLSYYSIPIDSCCFFDIETTGLSAKISSLYLIGCLWYDSKEDSFHSRQWFADDYISEVEILNNFREFLNSYQYLLHYNGTGFDIPYIEKKCAQLEVISPFSTIECYDIYREVRKIKTLFDVPNLKLTTVEKLVGFLRHDVFTGKDCIEIYSQFIQKKYFRDPTKEDEKKKLLLHNLEDIIGTFLSSQLLLYKCAKALVSIENKDNKLHAIFSNDGHFPFPASLEIEPFVISFCGEQIDLQMPLYVGTLNHFFKDYKNYYYLPAEDTAIHKSVGEYVEKEFRQPAKASNCYTKKEGAFLPLPLKFQNDKLLCFRTDYKSKQNYILWENEGVDLSPVYVQIFNTLLQK